MVEHHKLDRSEDNQKVAIYTGSGAYHGSNKNRGNYISQEVLEMDLVTLTKYKTNKLDEKVVFETFHAYFPCNYKVLKEMSVPSQEELRNDGITFVWCPFEEAKQEAGPLTKKVLLAMEPFLERKKKFVYIDSKIQYFQTQDLPVDSKLWHVDGTIAIRDQRTQELGYALLHDMRARMSGSALPPKYLAYQSSHHCATQFVTEPVSLRLPDFLTSFDLLDQLVQERNPMYQAQPAGSIVSFDGLSLHRAVPAQADGWRLWIRCIETDREVKSDSSITSCYGTVFRAPHDDFILCRKQKGDRT